MTPSSPDALLITKPENVRYLSDFSGEGMALIAGAKKILFTDGRYVERAKSEVKKGWKVILIDRQFDDVFRAGLAAMQISTLGFEADYVTVARLAGLKKKLRGTGVTLTPTEGVIEEKRRVKSAAEIETIAKACAITSLVLKKALPAIRRGVTEIDIVEIIRQLAVKHGAMELAFDTIVAFGENAAIPHAAPGHRKLKKGDVVLIDMGVKIEGFCSDMTRTFFTADPSDEERLAYESVLQAQCDGVENARAGMRATDVDAVVRSVLGESLAPYFTHSTGHGVGVEIHEWPRLAPTSADVLTLGNVVTIEPGVYVPGDFGIRIEDTVVIEKAGPRILTPFPKKLTVLKM